MGICGRTACSLFDICLHLFLDRPVTTGKVIAVDEAHKVRLYRPMQVPTCALTLGQYMTGSASAQRFTDTLLSTIRLQRHLGVRVLVSTQEPTISSKLLDLCSCTIVHRFSSPEWLAFLRSHIAGAEHGARTGLMARVVALNCGEAFVFAPSALVTSHEADSVAERDAMEAEEPQEEMFWGMREPSDLQQVERKMAELTVAGTPEGAARIEKMGVRYMRARIRKRITADGGKSLLAIR